MERNIDDFLQDPELPNKLASLSEQEFYESLEKDLVEAFNQIIAPYSNVQPTNTGDAKLEPLNKTKAAREYVYGGKSTSIIKRQDKIELSKNQDFNLVKSVVRSAFQTIIASASKTTLGDQITSILRQTETRLFQKIDQKIRAEQKNG